MAQIRSDTINSKERLIKDKNNVKCKISDTWYRIHKYNDSICMQQIIHFVIAVKRLNVIVDTLAKKKSVLKFMEIE